MYYIRQNRNAHIVFLVLLVIALFVFVGWLGYNAGLHVETEIGDANTFTASESVDGPDTYLTTISLAENAGLQDSSGVVTIDPATGKLVLDVVLPSNVSLPNGSALEAWLVDAGQAGGLGQTSVSGDDERFGTPFANNDFATLVNRAPYALSVGRLAWDSERESFHLFHQTTGNLAPYDAVMVTLESDASQAASDPRPGTPILIGQIGATP